MNRILFIKHLLLLTLSILLLSCGGSGGGGDNTLEDESPPPIPLKVEYAVGDLFDIEGSGVILNFADHSSAKVGFYLDGTYVKNSQDYTLYNRDWLNMKVTPSNLVTPLWLDPFYMRVEETLEWRYGNDPTAGSFIAYNGPDSVRISINNSIGESHQAGVDISLVESNIVTHSVTLTWEQFKTILETPDAYLPFQIQAAYSYLILQTVYDPVQMMVTGIDYINNHNAELYSAGNLVPYFESCELFPFNGTQGDHAYIWWDAPGEIASALGAGDNFMIDFHNCWKDDLTNTVDVSIDRGRVVLYCYWENITGAWYAFPHTSVQKVNFTRTEVDGNGVPVPLSTVTVDSFGNLGKTGFAIALTPDTSGIINITNMVSLGETAFTAITMPREVGDFVIEQFLNVGDGGTPNDLCNAGGSASYTLAPVTLPVATGHVMSVTFNKCNVDSGDESAIYNGNYTATVNNLIGQLLASADYAATITVSPINFQLTDDVGTSIISGGMRFNREANSGNLSETAASLSSPLTISESGETVSFDSFSISSSMSASGDYSFAAIGESVVISHSDYSDSFTLNINLPVQGNTGFAAPYEGSLNLVATDGSILSASIDHSVIFGAVFLEVDSDGDGIADETIVRDWEEFD